MTRSLQRRLSVLLGAAIVLAGLVAAGASFLLAYGEATEFQDDMLRQIAVLADASPPMETPGRAGPKLVLDDPESRVRLIPLAGDRAQGLPRDLAPGFHTLESNGERLRVFVHADPSGAVRAVAQPTETRDELALDSAWRTLVPLLLLLPLLVWLIVRVVRHELAPTGRLAAHLDAQPAGRPQALSEVGIPEEITPFVLAINRLLVRVGDLMEQQRRFIADAAHEIRSPLTALSVQAQNLGQAGSLEAMRERVVPLQAGIERARRLTERLLSLARIQAGTAPTEEVDVSALARELIAEYLPTAQARGIDLGLDELASLRVEAAPESLRLILRNGLENALKYVAEGGEVTLRLEADETSAVMDVLDNGPGIPRAERSRVLDPFYRLPDADGEGSGLGLTIAREAAARQGGSLSLLDPPEGSGLIFRYRQPRIT